jgi:hypothetical protein
MEVSGQLHVPAALLPGMKLQVLGRRMSGPQSRSESDREVKISFPMGESNICRPARSLVARASDGCNVHCIQNKRLSVCVLAGLEILIHVNFSLFGLQ